MSSVSSGLDKPGVAATAGPQVWEFELFHDKVSVVEAPELSCTETVSSVFDPSLSASKTTSCVPSVSPILITRTSTVTLSPDSVGSSSPHGEFVSKASSRKTTPDFCSKMVSGYAPEFFASLLCAIIS